MKFQVITLFPAAFNGYLTSSILGRVIKNQQITVNLIQLRDFARDKHHTCDDYPFGGGAGMIFKPEPLALCLDSVRAKGKRVVLPTPAGRSFNSQYALELSKQEELVLICGRYEGIDQRIIDIYVDDEISIGDYILSSGEVAAMVIIDTIARLIEGIISPQSLTEESYSDGLLEYAQYTRPQVFKGRHVPEVLLSGHHEKIRQWRLNNSILKTAKYRPDLLKNPDLSKEIKSMIKQIREQGGKDESDKGI